MTRSVYRRCKLCGDLHDVFDWPDNHREMPPNRSNLAAPMVIRDEMDALQGQHDGRMYTSKRGLRKSYREHGVIEVGDDPSVLPGRKPRAKITPKKADIDASVSKAVSQVNLTSRKQDELPTR